MPSLADARPRFSPADVEQIVCDRYGLAATASPLPSDRDQNFLLRRDGKPVAVLKVASAAEDRGMLEMQAAMMARLEACGVPAPRVRPSREGERLLSVEADGRTHLAWLVSYLPGVPLAEVSPHSPGLLRSLGHTLGRLGACLADFDHAAAHRTFDWDLRHAPTVIRRHLGHVRDAERRALVGRFLDRFERDTAMLLSRLRTSVIHGDANDFNVLVGPPTTAEREVVGLIDFGDVVHSYTVADPAIAAAYAMLDKPDPVAAAAHVAAGYHAAHPLTEAEIEALFPLVTMRLCVSVAMSAFRQTAEPDDAYLTISERPAWDLLERLDAVPPQWAHLRLRAACGFEPSPSSPAVVAWLRAHADEIAPVVAPDPSRSPVVVFDFSVGSTDWSTAALSTPMLAADVLTERMRAAGAKVGVGRYDEARLVYSGAQFRTSGGPPRTIHIGMDLFQPAGAPLFAPLDGVVHSFADNDLPLDYGPTIILEHRPDDCPPFFTLYGHLSADSLDGLEDGQAVRKGERFAALGAPDENGGWAPHLHFQLITDLLGARGDFPGVGGADERDVWRSLCPDPNLLLRIPAEAFPPREPTHDAILDARRERLGPSLSVSYRQPLHIVRGAGTYLYDADGRAYLDCVNNVCHVGHAHPRVVAAAAEQMATLNTNTRYLHPTIVAYAERLTALLPDPLSVCFFVNSGSEANDLALRLARTHTAAQGVVALDGAYHGHTAALIDVSPYKHDGPGGAGAPPHVRIAPMPDVYRGLHRDSDASARYAEHVADAVAELQPRHGVAAFIAESVLSCGGQIVLPDGFLAEAYRHVRAAGGVCIADEVQVGFGRVGSHFWGFETQGVVPDIVTLGKPIGNGHPLAAVVTTPEIAASFANGMEYFNTFGGNPVSCAVGLAVLDVLRDEGLQARALRVGSYLKDRLDALRDRHAIVGDVRGLGLFLGIELVLGRDTRAPAPAQATYLVERMREHGVLLSTDGPLHNVIKIKPPLPFGEAEADRLADTLDRVLGEDFLRA
ncbi:MAG: aminotransferase class III-fold pyridoxal phosphate-dependent enzyme [Rhodothermales bacterium]